MIWFSNATRRALPIAACAAGLILGSACSSKAEPEPAYPEPPPSSSEAEGAEGPSEAGGPGAAPPAAGGPDASAESPAAAGGAGAASSSQPGASQPGAAPPGPGQASPRSQGADVTDQELSKFAAAYRSIMELQAGYQEEFRDAQTEEEAREIEQRAQQDIAAAVQEQGLSPRRFDEIALQVDGDPELQKRVQEELGAPPAQR